MAHTMLRLHLKRTEDFNAHVALIGELREALGEMLAVRKPGFDNPYVQWGTGWVTVFLAEDVAQDDAVEILRQYADEIYEDRRTLVET